MGRAVRVRLRRVLYGLTLFTVVVYISAKWRDDFAGSEGRDERQGFVYTHYGKCFNLSHCEDNRLKVDVPEIRKAQLVLTRMLRVFALICEEHFVRYVLYRGTLLGAARDTGFNTFDDDIDVAVPKRDFALLVDALQRHLPDDIMLQTEETDPNYSAPALSCMTAALRDTRSCYTSIPCEDSECPYNGLRLKIHVLPSSGSGYFLDMYSSESYLWRYIMGPLWFKHGDIFPVARLRFEGFMFDVPRNWKQVLRTLYGMSFMRVPPKSPLRRTMAGSIVNSTHNCMGKWSSSYMEV
ncbi:predicted protein [Nematostella vectensis]|uniref:LicD/FKTN/FKRP nucleotidyltransferase domain-containing protein n=1 Tax=Nematostella vectensis TaxID=45351 RepID=A7SPJ7_NEMVE|nr:predicted protein [Nematostella vectensis]|eukprot:XP_001626464.1 predicted protein [Nematostella vectensis]